MYSIFRPIDRIILILMLRAIPPPASTSSLTIGFAPVQSPDSGASRRLNLAQCENQRDAGRWSERHMTEPQQKAWGSRILPFNGSRTDHGLIAADGKQACLGAQPPSTREIVQSYELPLDGIRLLISSRMLVARAMRLYLARKSAFAC